MQSVAFSDFDQAQQLNPLAFLQWLCDPSHPIACFHPCTEYTNFFRGEEKLSLTYQWRKQYRLQFYCWIFFAVYVRVVNQIGIFWIRYWFFKRMNRYAFFTLTVNSILLFTFVVMKFSLSRWRVLRFLSRYVLWMTNFSSQCFCFWIYWTAFSGKKFLVRPKTFSNCFENWWLLWCQFFVRHLLPAICWTGL